MLQLLAILTALIVLGFLLFRLFMRSPSTDKMLDFSQPEADLDSQIKDITLAEKNIENIAKDADDGIKKLKNTRDKAQEFLSDD